ncbi:MAG TPA: glutamate 5-kinase [Acidimicrobiales bacterium]|nr:glutamate 5-kinase [Acidimicrobiales bacterium]
MTTQVVPGRRGGTVVVKVGSSSVTTPAGEADRPLIDRLCREIASVRAAGHDVVVVSSGAIAVGWSALGRPGPRPSDPAILQAVSAVGQQRLMAAWQEGLTPHALLAGQVLLAPLDFVDRRQYLHARQTFTHLLGLGVVPVVNENDAVADEEIRFGDNDRLGALVAHLVRAETLVLLTDAPGLLTGDPRMVEGASLIEEVVEIDHRLELVAGGPGTPVGSGGMSSKLAAAKIATWSGVRAVIADAARPGVLAAALAGEPGAGTVFRPRDRRLPARKLWIAFARSASGTLVVDDGARRALVEEGRSLLAAGVVAVRGSFVPDDAVEIEGVDGAVFAKGLTRAPSALAGQWVGRRTEDLPGDVPSEVVHRDDLVVLAGSIPPLRG